MIGIEVVDGGIISLYQNMHSMIWVLNCKKHWFECDFSMWQSDQLLHEINVVSKRSNNNNMQEAFLLYLPIMEKLLVLGLPSNES